MTDAATTRGYGGVLLRQNTLQFFGGLWPDKIRLSTVIPIFVLEALTVVLGALTWAQQLHNKKVIFRCDSSNSCGTTHHPAGALNRLKSRNPALQTVADLWSDCQEEIGFDGLVYFCPGEANTWADIASRSSSDTVENDLLSELKRIGLHNVTVQRIPTAWIFKAASADILDDLYNQCKIHKESTLN